MNDIQDSAKVNAIKKLLRRLERSWPEEQALWLFCNGHAVYLMGTHPDGSRTTVSGAMDPGLIIAEFAIPCDGGGW